MTGPYGNAQKRAQIVETAYGLFKRNGFHATGIDRIIDEASVAKMTMYRHFPTKDALIVEVLRNRAMRFERQLNELEQDVTSSEEKIDRIFQWYGHWFNSTEFHGCVFQHAIAEFNDPNSEVYKAAVAQKQSLVDRMKKILEPSLPKSASSIATTLLMLLEGATLLAQMGCGEMAIQEARSSATRLIASAGEA